MALALLEAEGAAAAAEAAAPLPPFVAAVPDPPAASVAATSTSRTWNPLLLAAARYASATLRNSTTV